MDFHVFQRTTNCLLISVSVALSNLIGHAETHSSHRRFLLLAHTCALRCTVISTRTLTPCICGSLVTTMLMEISVYPFDYKPAVSWAHARNL